MTIGSAEWKYELMVQITDDQDRLNEFLPQCEPIVEDSRRLEEIEELLQTGDPGDVDTATEQRLDTQPSKRHRKSGTFPIPDAHLPTT